MSTYFDDASLVMIPSGYKDDKLYSIKPTSGDGDFTFSRDGSGASPATRVNSAGLIEKGRTNLLLQSNSFDTSPFVTSNVSVTSGQSGYDGTNDAWELSTTGVNGFENLYQNISFTGVHTISIYAKQGTNVYLTIRSLTSDFRVQFKLDDGTHSTTFGSTIDTFMIDAGNGWYRCGFTANFSSASSLVFYPQPIGTTDAGTIYIQDAQLEKGLVATSYIETTTAAASAGILGDMPRLDYSGGASCPSLLLEPQRSNLIIQSEYFGASTWLKRTSDGTAVPVVTDNYAISPEGVQNAARVIITKPTGNSQYAVINENKVITKTAGDKFTASVYLKATDATQVGKIVDLYAYDGSYMTMLNHTLTSDWVRVEAVHTATTGTSNVEMVTIGKARTSAGGTGTSDMATDFLVYGATFEAGSYPTSYVPTYGSATARAVDVCNKSSATSVIGQTEGTMFIEAKIDSDKTDDYNRIFGISQGNDSYRIIIFSDNQEKISLNVKNAGVSQAQIVSSISPFSTFKAAVGYAANDFVFYINGQQIGTDSSGTVPACNTISLGTHEDGSGTRGIEGSIKQALLFDTRLTNAELAALTTL